MASRDGSPEDNWDHKRGRRPPSMEVDAIDARRRLSIGRNDNGRNVDQETRQIGRAHV